MGGCVDNRFFSWEANGQFADPGNKFIFQNSNTTFDNNRRSQDLI